MNNTRKLSGPAKDRFFKRLFVDAGGLDIPTADRLTEAASELISSIRVRRDQRLAGPSAPELPVETADEDAALSEMHAPTGEEPFRPDPQPVFPTGQETDDARPRAQASEFDVFAFGLIPVYKREGSEGLSARLSEIGSVENLRAMAKAQQIVLARELRTGDIDITTLRAAILEAVARRIADRRAI